MAPDLLYDHPLYYDILFGFDRDFEAGFYHRCLERCGVGRGERVLEVAAGTGQVALRLARLGWRVTALDVRAAMLSFLAERARAEGLEVDTLCADMASSFASHGPFAAAYNPMSSFRLLHGDGEVGAHLRAMAGALRLGGV